MIWKLVTDCLFFAWIWREFNQHNFTIYNDVNWTSELLTCPATPQADKETKQTVNHRTLSVQHAVVGFQNKTEIKMMQPGNISFNMLFHWWTLRLHSLSANLNMLHYVILWWMLRLHSLSANLNMFAQLWWMFRLHSLSQCKLKHVILYCDGRLDSRLHSLSANSNMFMLYCDGCLDCSFKHVMLYCDGLLDCTISVQI